VSEIAILRRIADSVRDTVLEKFPHGGGNRRIGRGAGGDWTKEIDQVAEIAAIDVVKELDLDWNILSEESGAINRGGSKTLIFDPVDGTYNAANGIPFYSTSLAIANEGGEITAGLVLDIPMGWCFRAVKGGGAFLDGERINTRKFVDGQAVFASFLGPDSMEENRKILSWPKRGRYFGAISLEICLVARGAIDMFAMFSRVPRIMDVAAAHLILEEAGGIHIRILEDGSWDNYYPGDRDGIRGIIAVGDRGALDRIIEISSKTVDEGGVS
jgi:fructose-1,6-bisphosphatase/inositol monophosphatase family enzyme